MTNTIDDSEIFTIDELRVGDQLFQGLSKAKISQRLGMTPGTVNALCLSICSKVGVKSKSELLRIPVLSTWEKIAREKRAGKREKGEGRR